MKFQKLDFLGGMKPYDSIGDETVGKADFNVVVAGYLPSLTADEVREFSDQCPRITENRVIRIFYKKIHNEMTNLMSQNLSNNDLYRKNTSNGTKI